LPGATREAPQIRAWVAGLEWQYVSSLYGHASDEQVFVVRQDRKGDSWIQFGDGKTGARLPTGVDNVQISWRTGVGAFGPMKPNTDPSLAGRVEGLKSAKLPGVVAGGADPESGDHARDSAPGRLQSLDRLVSLADFESEALQIAGVAKASASWELYHGVPTILVRLLMEPGRTSDLDNASKRLHQLNDCRGPQRHPLKVCPAFLEYVFVDAAVAIDSRRIQGDVLADVRSALGVSGEPSSNAEGLFALQHRQLGQPEYASRIEGVIQNVDGVLWCQVTALGPLGVADDPRTLVVPPSPRPLWNVVPCARGRLLQLYHRADEPLKSPLTLSVAAAPPGECADG
jgi:predicted phage baseplate assembly protein